MGRYVLVVEDEPIIRMDAVAMLEEAGMDVVEFDRGDDALRYTFENRKDVAAIFTDVNLRGQLDGMQLASMVAHREPGVRVLVTSGRYDIRPDQLPAGVQFFRKPWLPLQVLTALQEAVAN